MKLLSKREYILIAISMFVFTVVSLRKALFSDINFSKQKFRRNVVRSQNHVYTSLRCKLASLLTLGVVELRVLFPIRLIILSSAKVSTVAEV